MSTKIVDISGIWWHQFVVKSVVNTMDGLKTYQWDIEITKEEKPFYDKDHWYLRMTCEDEKYERVSVFSPENWKDAVSKVNRHLAEFVREKSVFNNLNVTAPIGE